MAALSRGCKQRIGKISVYKHSFCYSNVPTTGTKELFVSTANRTLVSKLISIGDVSDVFAIVFVELIIM